MTFEQVEQLLLQTAQIANQNTIAISELRGSVNELRGSVDDLRAGISELREGQALLTEMFVQQQEQLIEFRRTTNATLDRIDRTLDELRRDRR